MDPTHVVKKLRERYPYGRKKKREPFKVLIATVLSHRTRDEKTAQSTERLFSIYKTPKEIANADLYEIEKLIKDVGFYAQKAKRIKEISRIISEKYGCDVPKDVDKLMSLPGVGRKTANCVLVYGFNEDAIPVDTHVHRIANRIGLVNTKSPEETEVELRKIVPKKYWKEINELLVLFGREICLPKRPVCDICPLSNKCPSYGKIEKGNKLGRAYIDGADSTHLGSMGEVE